MKSLPHYWYSSNKIVWLLLPLSWLYCSVVTVRRWLYKINWKKSFTADRPIVVIGNIVAGGSGKTPLLIAVCKYIKAKGFSPGVVSRGYGGTLSGIKQIEANDSADLVGDEPLMISRATDVPVVVGADRAGAVKELLSRNECDIVFTDDGLQHYRMARDIEIAVIDDQRMFGNGYCLPAGPLREPVSRLQETDLLVYSNVMKQSSEQCSYQLKMVGVRRLDSADVLPIESLAGKTVHAVAGIGHPERFFATLRTADITMIEHAFDDHHRYDVEDFSGWQHDCIIMTEKDAVKCSGFDLSDAWVLLVEAQLSSVLIEQLDKKLMPLLKSGAS